MSDGPATEQQQASAVEVKAFSPDHKLTTEETMEEADRLIGEFRTLLNKHNLATLHGNGIIRYKFDGGAVRGDDKETALHFERIEGEGADSEFLSITGSPETVALGEPRMEGKPKIEYSHKKNGELVDEFAGNGIAVDAARTLLAKTQGDLVKNQSLRKQVLDNRK